MKKNFYPLDTSHVEASWEQYPAFNPSNADIPKIINIGEGEEEAALVLNKLSKRHFPNHADFLEINPFQFSEDPRIGNYEKNRIMALGEIIRDTNIAIQTLRIEELGIELRNRMETLKFTTLPCNFWDFKSWTTSEGIKVYGTHNPYKSRLKHRDSEGNNTTGSILVKCITQPSRPERLSDLVGFEFLVKDEVSKENLTNALLDNFKYLLGEAKIKDKLPGHKKSDESATSYGSRALSFPDHPVSMHIYTFEENLVRTKNPDVRHEAYKKRQFNRLIPIIFPKEIYFK